MMTHTATHDLPNPVVTIPGLGAVKGLFDKDNKVAKFLNVPFGVVEKRWRPATKVQPWTGVRDGTQLGPMSPQVTENNLFMSLFTGVPDKYDYAKDMSERDCLNCNVFMPASAVNSTEKLPVMVWIYGGGLRYGSNATPLYECSDLVLASIEFNKPMIIVVLNYRENYLGFLSSKELILDAQEAARLIPVEERQWYDASCGNWGLLDLILGLQWVQSHIAAFSGDPKRVTAAGQSGGAAAVSYLQLIPHTHGLFRRVIIQSGSASLLHHTYVEEEGQLIFDRLCRVCGIPDDLAPLDKVERLRNVSAEKFVKDLDVLPFLLFKPTLDHVMFSEDSRNLIGDPRVYDPELEWAMTGTAADEGSLMVPQFGATNTQEFKSLLTRICAPDDKERFPHIYHPPASYGILPTTDAEVQALTTILITEGTFHFPALQINEAIMAHPTAQLSRYHFDACTAKIESMMPGAGAHHLVELFYLFGNATCNNILSTDNEYHLAKKVQSVWVEFVTALSPHTTSLIPKVSGLYGSKDKDGEEKKEALVFRLDGHKVKNVPLDFVERLTKDKIEFWRRSYAYTTEQSKLGRSADFGFDCSKSIKE
ncbi:hypothetical protein FBU30_001749 [Linnemannia zychae]|nr:hypothetical protein FBU30_001749 [Linnemannia zychae]